MVKQKEVICFECAKKVDILNDKCSVIETYDKGDLTQKDVFHFDCWTRWLQRKISDHSRRQISRMQETAVGLIGNIKSLTGGFGGLDNIEKMVSKELEIEPKKKDDGKPRKRTKKK